MGKMVILHPLKQIKSYIILKSALEFFVKGKGYIITNRYQDIFKAIDKFPGVQKAKFQLSEY